MIHRIKKIISFVRGDLIILEIKRDTLVVDAGNNTIKDIKNCARVFFKKAYSLR